MTGRTPPPHVVLVKRTGGTGMWFVRCTAFECGWPRRDGLTRSAAQALADGHQQATS